MLISNRYVEDGSYLKLKSLNIGYVWKPNFKGISNVNVYASATNLFTITGYSGIDPEVNANPTGQSGFYSDLRIFPTLNMDFGTYPRARTFTFGANITF